MFQLAITHKLLACLTQFLEKLSLAMCAIERLRQRSAWHLSTKLVYTRFSHINLIGSCLTCAGSGDPKHGRYPLSSTHATAEERTTCGLPTATAALRAL